MERKRSHRKRSNNVPLFIVEGYTEENYIKLLRKLSSKSVVVKNCYGGGANSVLLQSDKLLSDKDEASYYTSFVIMYDVDTYNPKYDTLRNKVENTEGVKMLILDPCFENWLLVHVSKKKVSRTINCDKCISALKKYIPNYEKDDFKLLEKYVNNDNFVQACNKQPLIGATLKEYFL
jgi:hypothetical protein